MKAEFANKLSRSFHKFGFVVKKNSPAILIGAGIVGVVTSTVLACKATTKINDILDDAKEQTDKIHAAAEDQELIESGVYTEQDAKKDLTIVYTKTGLKIAKLYAPSVVLGALSITGIVASHRILTKRNAALSAAFVAVDTSFKNYRKNVKERFGDRIDHELKYGIKAEEVKILEVDEDGNTKETTKVVDTVDADLPQYSRYARFFDECNPNWQRDAEYNLFFLRTTEQHANDKLRLNGFLFLNEVYDMLGIPKSKEGQIVGWVYNSSDEYADNYVDFGIFDINKRRAQDFVNGYEKSILLDFNVQGNVWETLK